MKISNFKFQISNSERGQSMFELVVALAISALVITALVSLVSNSIQNSNFSKNKTLAANYSQQATEWLRGQRDSDITTFITNVQTAQDASRCLNQLSWSTGPCAAGDVIAGTPFIRQVVFTTSSVSGKSIIEASVTVSWTDSQGDHQVKSATSFSDWRER